MPKVYSIRPLRWRRNFTYWQQEYRADTPFVGSPVARTRENYMEKGPWGKWSWGYCFQEYHDESYGPCASAIEGKALAQAHWEERLSSALKLEERS
jgi:hypothetical protein